MKLKHSFLIIPSLIIIAFISISWGAVGHNKISHDASLSFIQEMSQFNTWTSLLASHASDADARKDTDPTEGVKHYIDIDNYPIFVSTGRIPQTIDSMNAMYGSSTVTNNGTLPWTTKTTVDSLRNCFARLDWAKALFFAEDLGHYVGDGHMPLHITANYDGAQTGNSGIHSRYESTMIGSYVSQINYTGDTVVEVQDVNQYIFDYLYASYKYKDSVLLADTYAKTISSNTSSSLYKDALWQKTKTYTIMLFKKGSHALAELIYTAWKQAGSPAMPNVSVFSKPEAKTSLQLQNSPNPFNNNTLITYTLNENSRVELLLCDISGKQIESIKSATETAGKHQLQWNTQFLSSGIYFLKIKTATAEQTIKLVKGE